MTTYFIPECIKSLKRWEKDLWVGCWQSGLKELGDYQEGRWHGVRLNSQSQYCPYYIRIWGIKNYKVKFVSFPIDSNRIEFKMLPLEWLEEEYYSDNSISQWLDLTDTDGAPPVLTYVPKDLSWCYTGHWPVDKRKICRGRPIAQSIQTPIKF